MICSRVEFCSKFAQEHKVGKMILRNGIKIARPSEIVKIYFISFLKCSNTSIKVLLIYAQYLFLKRQMI